MEVVDPTSDFTKEFIAAHYHNRDADSNSVSKSYAITYGIGNSKSEWSPIQLGYLISIDIDVRSDGARIHSLKFGSLPSLKSKGSEAGWPLVDWGGRHVVTAGKAGFNNKKVSDLFIKTDTGQPEPFDPGKLEYGNLQGQPTVQGSPASVISEDKKKAASDFIDFLDEAAHLAIKRYIGNITGLGPAKENGVGNVIVLMPSFKYTKVMQHMHRILSNKFKTKYGLAPWAFNPRNNPSVLINDYLLKNFSNLQAYSWQKTGSLSASAVMAKPEFERPTKRAMMEKYPLRKNSDGMLVFQAHNSAFKIDEKTKEDTSIDWMKPLNTFGMEFADSIDNMSIQFRRAFNYGSYFGRMSHQGGTITTLKTFREVTGFGVFDWIEIEEVKKLNILKEQGLIERASDRCFVWGEVNMVRMLLGELAKGDDEKQIGLVRTDPSFNQIAATVYGTPNYGPIKTEPIMDTNKNFYNEVKKVFPAGLGEGSDFLVANDLHKINKFVFDDEITSKMSRHQMITKLSGDSLLSVVKSSIESVKSVINNSPARHLDIAGLLVPILRSNVTNANVISARLQMNPHYWGQLARTVTGMTATYKKRDAEVLESEITQAELDESLATHEEFDHIIATLEGILKQERERKPKTGALSMRMSKKEMQVSRQLEQMKEDKAQSPVPIYHKTKPSDIEVDETVDLAIQTQLFYERLYRLAGPQLDIVSYPMFLYSSMADISRPVYVLMRQPTVLGGIDSSHERDPLALKGKGPESKAEMDMKVKRQFSDLGTGFYFLAAFEHKITDSAVESRFRLVKNAFLADEVELKEYRDSLIEEEALQKFKAYQGAAPGATSWNNKK